MMRSRPLLFVLSLFSPALSAQGDPAQPDTKAGLVACITEILTALQGKPGQATPLIRALLLPEHERWFAQAFQPETAARGAKEYARLTADPERFEQEMRKMLDGLIKEQRTKVAAERIEPGEGGTGLQKSAFAAMLKPVPLYTVKMGKDSPSGYSIWSFVHVQGRFRLLGKMREALRDADKGPAGEPPAPDIKAFQAFAETLAAGKVEGSDLVLPDAEAWFAARFAAPLAATLAREYAAASAQLPRALPAGIQKTIGDGKTDVRVQTFHKAVDPEANGLVNAALQRMSVPTPLFVLRLVKPGESDGTTYWSFVHAGGAFRFVGKLAAIRPGGKATSGDLVADTLCALPLGAAEKVLQEKGLLTGSAVEYLRKEGTLR